MIKGVCFRFINLNVSLIWERLKQFFYHSQTRTYQAFAFLSFSTPRILLCVRFAFIGKELHREVTTCASFLICFTDVYGICMLVLCCVFTVVFLIENKKIVVARFEHDT